jgi:hypothetical protein
MSPGAAAPTVGPSKRLDCELELGIYVGAGNPQGTAIAMNEAESHVFGFCILNDWLRRSSEPVRGCSAKLDPVGFRIQREIVRREMRKGRKHRDRTVDGFDQPV